MNNALTWFFWMSALGVFYVYAGFPLLLVLAGSVLRRRVSKSPKTTRRVTS